MQNAVQAVRGAETLKVSLLGAVVTLAFATAGMGLPLAGEGAKFSAANIAPIIFTATAGLYFMAERRRVSYPFLWGFLTFNAAALLSFAAFLFRFQWAPNFFVLLFQDVEILFCTLLVSYGLNYPNQFRSAVRVGIYVSILPVAYFGLSDLRAGEPFSAFGMDDHSHTAVLFCCEAYILIRFCGGILDRLLAFLLFVLSFLTMSRLPVFFIPAIFLAFVNRSRASAIVAILVSCVLAAILVVHGDTVLKVFKVLDRLSSVATVSGEDSTSSHFYLLKAALEIKFEDLAAFLLGTGPGNFSQALTSFNPQSAVDLASIDPKLFADAQHGKAPLHSVVMQMLLDYNIAIFLLILILLAHVVSYLLRPGKMIHFAFFSGFLAASTFYSLHNKPYYYLVAVTAAVFILHEDRTRECANPVSTARPGHT